MSQSQKSEVLDNEGIKQLEVNVIVGIETFNSGQILENMVSPLRSVVDAVIVCDNGSTDSTLDVAKKLDCKCVSLDQHIDDRAATLALFKAALEISADVLIVIQPGTLLQRSDIENLASRIEIDHYDVVVGTNRIIGKSDLDQSPVKAYSKNALSKITTPKELRLDAAEKLKLEVSKLPVSFMPKESIVITRSKDGSPTKKSALDKIFYLKAQPLSSRFLFTNVSFLRTLMLASGAVISALVFAYSFIFLDQFLRYASTTSYYPWRWGIAYSNPGAVMNLFSIGIGISLGSMILFALVFFRWVSPQLKISLAAFEKRLQLSRQNYSD